MKITLKWAILNLLAMTAVITDETGHCQQQTDDYFNRRHLHITSKQIDYDIPSRTSTVNGEEIIENQIGVCHHRHRSELKDYTKEDIVNCFDSLFVKRNERRMHIAFVGDSVMRQNFLSFLRVSPSRFIVPTYFALM